jgi:hypothetical protein
MTIHLERVRNDTYPDRFQLYSKETGQVADITGCTFELVIDVDIHPPDATNRVVVEGVVVDYMESKVEFPFSAGDVDRVGKHYYWLKMVDAGGKIRTIQHGRYQFI